jgi:hypothetical protein
MEVAHEEDMLSTVIPKAGVVPCRMMFAILVMVGEELNHAVFLPIGSLFPHCEKSCFFLQNKLAFSISL